jgi:hypothetical protein
MAAVRLLTRSRWRWALLAGIVFLGGIGAGLALPAAAPASPGGRQAPPREAFKSGSERSVPLLREIAQTLDRMDTRLQRIEQAVLSAAGKQQASPAASRERR